MVSLAAASTVAGYARSRGSVNVQRETKVSLRNLLSLRSLALASLPALN